MIRYRLSCGKGHEFEAWFKSSATYDRQSKRGQLACPDCGSTRIDKAIMAPRIATHRQPTGEVTVANPTATSQADTRREMRALMRKLRTEIEKHAEYVGPRFAEEARKIHYEERDARGIYGEASAKDVRELGEEGIECYPLPPLPEDQN